MNMKVDLSITIVNYKTKELLRNCLQSLFLQKGDIGIEVFVVDNASNDDTAKMIRYEFPQVTLFTNNENIGFAAATNQGLKVSNGRYLMLLNPDTLILDNALRKIVKFMDDNEEISVVAPRLLNTDGSLQRSCRSFPNILNMLFWYLLPFLKPKLSKPSKYLTDFWDHSFNAFVDYAIGAALVIRRNCFNDVGYLDEKFFVYGEEKDFCYRLKLKGYKTYYLHDVAIMHYGGQSSISNPRSLIYLHQSHIYYVNKYCNYFEGFAIKIIFFLGAFIRILLGFISNKYNQEANRALIIWYIKNLKFF